MGQRFCMKKHFLDRFLRNAKWASFVLFQLLLRSLPGLMGAHYKRFFCGYAEPAYIKQRKMQVGAWLAHYCLFIASSLPPLFITRVPLSSSI